MKVGRGSFGPRLIAGLIIGLSMFFLLQAGGAAAAAPPIFLGSFGPDGTPETNFERAGSVAVDEGTGDVYVLDIFAHSLYKFDAKGNPVSFTGTAAYISQNAITGLPVSEQVSLSQVAVDQQTHTIYVTGETHLLAFEADGERGEFSAGSGAGTNEIGGFGTLSGVAVDLNGDIYAADRTSGVSIFARGGEEITSFSTPEAANLAVSAGGSVYVNSYGAKVTEWSPSSFPVTAATTYSAAAEPVNPNATFAVAVDIDTGRVYLTNQTTSGFRAQILVYEENGDFVETIGGPGQEGELYRNASGIGINAATETIYAGSAGFTDETFSQVRIFGPEPVGPPTFTETFASEVTSDSARLGAVVNPHRADVTYHFEYGLGDCSSSVCIDVPIGGGSIGGDEKGAVVSDFITGLSPDTTYHFRIVAENSSGPAASPDRTFRSQRVGSGFQLADSRVWEMVTPADKHGGTLYPIASGQIQAAAGGNAITYVGTSSFVADPEGSRAFEPASTIGRRGAAGWGTEDITPPHQSAAGLQPGSIGEYKVFTPDLSRAVLEPRAATLLSPQASERTPYIREDSTPAVYTPLVTGKEGYANVPPGTKFGGESAGGIRVAGVTKDLTHVVLSSRFPLVAGAPEAALYEWTAGQLQAVSVLPAGEGGGIVEGLLGTPVDRRSVTRGAVSDDGSRVFWSRGAALYMRDLNAGETIRLNVATDGSGLGDVGTNFQGASADGTVAYFTSAEELTADSSPAKADLYRCEIPNLHGAGCATLTDISAPPTAGASSEVQNVALAVSPDGDKVYFVAEGVLDTSLNPAGAAARSGEPNLYLWAKGRGTRFIATLSSNDRPDWATREDELTLSAASSPNGRYLTFMSERGLTGQANRDATTGKPAEEVYRYDADGNELACISCNPNGALPQAQAPPIRPDGQFDRPFVDSQGIWENSTLAASLPQVPSSSVQGPVLYHPRMMLDNGRTFFNAFDSLVPADSNGDWDAYEYEPLGLGDCTNSSGSNTVSRSGDGCVSLVSSGGEGGEVTFFDASESGNDVFFATTAQLSVLDADGERDVYDARVDGTEARLTPRTECQGEACLAAPQAPNDATPASAGFTGAGNLAPHCPAGKRRVKRHGKPRCAKQKHRKHRRGSHRANKKAGTHR